MDFLPAGTTWLDFVTLGIALGGSAIAIAGLLLAFWRYRSETRVGVRVEVGVVESGGDGLIAVIMTNTELRTVTVERTGLATTTDGTGTTFERWHSVNVRRSQTGLPLADAALPRTLEPGSAPYGVLAGVRSIKTAFHPAVPTRAFCVDTYRNTYWGEIPADVQAAIQSTKRRIIGPNNEYGHPTAIEIPDDVEVEQSALYDRPSAERH
jgi:hypothetical protein